MVKRRPLLGPVWGGGPNMTKLEWTMPGPSLEVQPAPVPLTQWISSTPVALKLAARRFPVTVKLEGLMAVGSV